jgi:hypothetical protein
MANDDYAVIAGISHYPDPAVGSLQGSDLDADAFRAWLVDPAGGAVPDDNIRFINSVAVQSPQPHAGQPVMPWHARPRENDITSWFDELQGRAQGLPGRRIGRRLYIYFAGHGVVSKFAFQPLLNDAALLMANATKTNAPHIFGRIYATYFMKAGIFDEVALFMDCCRDVVPTLVPRMLTYADLTAISQNPIDRGYYVFATEWSRNSREKQINGAVRGVFTAALLAGLRGDAADATGAVTTTSLSEYLRDHMKDLLTPEEIADPNIPKSPDIDGQHAMVFAQFPPPRFTVNVKVPAIVVGQRLRVRDGKFRVVYDEPIAAASWAIPLGKGSHLFEIVPGAAPLAGPPPAEQVITLEGDRDVELA